MKILRSLTWPVFTLLIVLGAAVGWFFLQDDPQQAWRQLTRSVVGNGGDDSSKSNAAKEDTAEISRQIEQGNALISEARRRLARQPESWTASVLQLIQTPDQTYRGTGRYIQAANGKSRLEISMEIAGVHGKLLQVSNGNVVWQIEECRIPEAGKSGLIDALPEYDLQIQRVDLQRIVQYAESSGLDPDRPEVVRESLGGLASLLATLEVEMNFQPLKKVSLQDETVLVLDGTWKNPLRDRAYESRQATMTMLSNAPDKVRLYLRERDLLPVRYLCLKQKDSKGGWYAPLALEFSDIVPSAVIDASLFQYLSPDDRLANDTTHEAIRRLEAHIAIRSAAESMDQTSQALSK